jgi:hypothetical protein
MAEPKDKNSKEWREWHLRHNGIDAQSIRIAIKNRLDIKILKRYLEDLEGGEN